MLLKRINQIIENEAISIRKFEKKIGTSDGVIGRAIRNNSDIQSKWVELIADNYPQYSPTWLLTGKGSMLTDGAPSEGGKAENTTKPASIYKDKPPVPLKVIEINPEAAKTNTLIADVQASAGIGNIVEQHEALEDLPAIHIPNAPQGLNIAFQITGDSMHPTIRHLDYVAGTKINDPDEISDGYAYIIIDASKGVLCKRLYRMGADWQVVSDNPTYPPENRHHSKIIAIFKAFCHWSYDFRNYHDDVRMDIQQLKADIQRIIQKQQL